MVVESVDRVLREAEKANIPFLAALPAHPKRPIGYFRLPNCRSRVLHLLGAATVRLWVASGAASNVIAPCARNYWADNRFNA